MPFASALAAPPYALRPYAGADQALYIALFTDPAVMARVGPTLAPAQAERAAAVALLHQQAPTGRFRHWVVEHPDGTAGLIALALRGDRWAGGEAELGALLWPAWQGRGAATAATRALLPWAWRVAGLQALTSHHREENALAEGAMRRLGFRPMAPRPDSPLPRAWILANDTSAPAAASGRLACVGLGMQLGAHLTPRARGWIESADVVFVAASDALVEAWVATLHPRTRSLQRHYAEGKPRPQTYREMVEAMLSEVRAGRRVVGAFYGHPGVFAQVPHAAIAQARAEGFEAVMEPGISAEACLYADLGLDPGQVGCAHFEASQLLFFRRVIDTSAWLVLWQIGLAGDRTYAVRASTVEQRQRLVDRLLEDYPPDHPVTVYEAATLPIAAPRIDTLPLSALAHAALHMHSTLVVPPARPLEPAPPGRIASG